MNNVALHVGESNELQQQSVLRVRGDDVTGRDLVLPLNTTTVNVYVCPGVSPLISVSLAEPLTLTGERPDGVTSTAVHLLVV